MINNPKVFTILFLCGLFLTLSLNFILFEFDRTYSGNDIIRKYQLSKIEDDKNYDTIIVGDSSAGNAIDANYFSQLSGHSTKNLALTADFGLVGSLSLMDKALVSNPNIKNVIIIQIFDIWSRPFSREGVFEVTRGSNLNLLQKEFPGNIYIEYLEYATQLRNSVRFVRHLFEQTPLWGYVPESLKTGAKLNFTYDYLSQEPNTFANNKKSFPENERLKNVIDPSNLAVLGKMDTWCAQKNIRCILVGGPIHERVYQNSLREIEQIQTHLLTAKNIIPIEKVFFYDNSFMGDSIYHIDPVFKKKVTEEYSDALRGYLQ